MKTEFIPYEQALELKQLGFDEACICYYDIEDTNKLKPTPMKEEINSFRFNSVSTMVAAPLCQQAFRWFREKHGLASQFAYYHVPKWTFEILEFTDIKMTPNKLVVEYSTPKTYEEAELACLNKLIEIVKNEQ